MEHLAGMITTWLIRQEVIDEGDRELYEYAAHSFVFYLIYIVLLLFGKERYAVCVGVGILQTVVLQVPCILQKMTKKVKNMSFHSRQVEK